MKEIEDKIKSFLSARGWGKDPSADLAKSIVIEAAELLEHFQWGTNEEKQLKNIEEITMEVADVFMYLMMLCIRNKIDLVDAVDKKLSKLEVKYPVEMFNGKHNEEVYRSQKRKYRNQ